jgi:hypothetical protein
MSHRRWPLLACLVSLFAVSPVRADGPRLEDRWVYLQLNLQVAENVDKAEALLRRAAAAGYNGVVLADYKLNILDRVPSHYFRHAARVKALARELKIEIIPTVAPIGYSDGLLAHNPNLAEGIPVKDAPFVVRDGVARLDSELKDALPGGDFERHKDHAAAGWNFQDGPGQASFIDTAVKRTGQSALRFEDLGQTAAPSGNGRVSRVVAVQPWRQFHASVWIKTEGFDAASSVRLFAMGKDGRVLSHSNLGVKRDQDWTEHHILFNSLENDEIRINCGTWGGRGGKMWIDDLRLEETAFVNLLRRPGCPLVVIDEKGQPFEEGRDYQELRDPLMGNVPYAGSFDVYHEPPVLRIPRGSRIQDGHRLRVSFYHTVTIYDSQVTCCLAEPEVFRILEDQVRRVEELFTPKTYFLSHDEIRVANWCEACRRKDRTAGQLLAENMRQCVAVIRKVNPTARLCVWSDMFDPAHNARGDFYLVNGDLAGSWEGLPKEMTIVNWNRGEAAKSVPWFGQRGHTQVLAGYYDGKPADIAAWLKTGANVTGLRGAMYTTWRSDFSQLEPFAKAAWGSAVPP